MLTLILGAAALGVASFGSFAGARSISNIHDLKDQPKIMRDSYEESLTNFSIILDNTQNKFNLAKKEAQEYDNEVKEYKKFQESMIPQIQKLIEIIEQNEQNKDQKQLDEIKKLIVNINTNTVISDNNSTPSSITNAAPMAVDNIIKDNNFVRAANDILSQDLAIQNSFNNIFNWLSKCLLIISGGNLLIASLLATSHIIVSPVILICALALYYAVNKSLIKVKEYELEINNSIYKIDSAQGLVQEQRQKIQEKRDEIKKERQKISEATQQLKYVNELINKLEFRDKASKITKVLADSTSLLLYIFPEYSNYKSIISLVTLAKDIVLKFFSPDQQSMLNNVIENLKEGNNNLTIVGLDAVMEVHFDRKLLYPYPIDNTLNLDVLLSVSSKFINLIPLLENKAMSLFHFLGKLKLSKS